MAIITNTAKLGALPLVIRDGDYRNMDRRRAVKRASALNILAKQALRPFYKFLPREVLEKIPAVDASAAVRPDASGKENRGKLLLTDRVIMNLESVLGALEVPVPVATHEVSIAELDQETKGMFLARVATPNQLRRFFESRAPEARVELFSDLVDAGRKMKSLEPPKALLSALEGIQSYRLLQEIEQYQKDFLPAFVDCVVDPHYDGLAASFRTWNGHVFPRFIKAAREQGNGATRMFFDELNRRTGNGVALAEMFRQLNESKGMRYFWENLSHPRKKEFVLALRLNSSAFKYCMLVAIAGPEVIKSIEAQLVTDGAIVKLPSRSS